MPLAVSEARLVDVGEVSSLRTCVWVCLSVWVCEGGENIGAAGAATSYLTTAYWWLTPENAQQTLCI